MKASLVGSIFLTITALPLAAVESCEYQRTIPEVRRLGDWIDAKSWLNPENLRLTLPAATRFMPAVRLSAPPLPRLQSAAKRLDISQIALSDPADGARRNVDFILGSRLDADALVVLKNGKLVTEHYWNGTLAEAPRLLLSGTHAILSLLGATAIAQGRLAADKAVSVPITSLADNTALRKLSIRRLLESEVSHAWSAEELAAWQQAGGWTEGKGGGVRSWLKNPDVWHSPETVKGLPPAAGRPEDDLLAWVIAESRGASLSQLFCETLFVALRPEHHAAWLTDPAGNELAAGLALSARDLAKLGHLLLEAHTAGKRSRLPDWLLAALTAPTGSRSSPELNGFPAGSEIRYGFVRLGGKGARIAVVGPYGNSLFVDFERRTVIALHASHPAANSPLLHATLAQLWQSISAAPDSRQAK